MICFGTPGSRRVGRHHFTRIGRATMWGHRLLQIVTCAYCDRLEVQG